MPRPARRYATFDVSYFNNDKVIRSGSDWQLHFAAILASQEMLTDGQLTRRQLARVAPESVTDIERATQHLIEVGLFDDLGDDRIAVHDWADWNNAAAKIEAEAKSNGGKKGNHLRWHERQGVVDPDCTYCAPFRERPDR